MARPPSCLFERGEPESVHLLIATPFYKFDCISTYTASLVDSVRVLTTAGINFDYYTHNGDSYVDRARNTICAKFLEGDYTDLLFIDSDMQWDIEAVGRLLKAPYEVVGGAYPMKNCWEVYPCVIDTDEKGVPIVDPATGLISAEWIMAGFLRIKRSCLEKMAEAYKDLAYQDPSADPTNPTRKYIPFFELKLGVGGEDMIFCRRWKAIGGKVWLEPRITFGHYGVTGYFGNFHEYMRRQPGGDKHGLKKLYVTNFNNCIPDLTSCFDYENTLEKADAAIIWNDIQADAKTFCQQAKTRKVPTFVMLHGFMLDGCDYDNGVFDADYYLVWSERDKQIMMERGCPENRLFVTGCPLFKQRTNKSDSRTVVYFPSHATDKLHEKKHRLSLEVWDKLNEFKWTNPVVKLLADHPADDYQGEKVISDRNLPNHIDTIYEVLENACCIVTDELGTNVLLAAYLDIPIIKIKNAQKNVFPEFIAEAHIDELKEAIRFAVDYPGRFRNERQEFAAMFDHGDCAHNIHTAVMSVLNGETYDPS